MEKTTYFYGYKKPNGKIEKCIGARVFDNREEAEIAMAEAKKTGWKMTPLEVFSTTRQKDEAFTKAMQLVWRKASGTGNDDVQDYILSYFNDDIFDVFDDDICEVAYKQDKSAMYYLLRGLMNYDWFWCKEDGSIDVENANDPYVAEALQPYVTKEMGLKALASF